MSQWEAAHKVVHRYQDKTIREWDFATYQEAERFFKSFELPPQTSLHHFYKDVARQCVFGFVAPGSWRKEGVRYGLED